MCLAIRLSWKLRVNILAKMYDIKLNKFRQKCIGALLAITPKLEDWKDLRCLSPEIAVLGTAKILHRILKLQTIQKTGELLSSVEMSHK